MNIETLASAITVILAPFTPFLVEIGRIGTEKLVEAINQHGGKTAWDLAQKLWEKINSSIGDDADIRGTTLMLSAKPEDETRRSMLATALAAKLSENSQLTREFSDLLGGQGAVQQILANRKSVVKDVTQQMSGVGEQTVKAVNSRIQGVKQIKR